MSTGVTGGSNPDLATSVQLNNLHSNVGAEDLREIMSKYGPVKFCYLLHGDDNEPLGVGRACFCKAESAKKAADDLKDATVDGVKIKITFLGDTGFPEEDNSRNISTRSSRNRRNNNNKRNSMDLETDEEGPRYSKNAPTDPMNPLSR